MKIEKVNDHQIRCTLTREDLANREIKISELAYGTDKAKNLFREMMQQAAYECGFEAEDIPLMIEAIPLNAECIVLIITKVEDPEELDTRFSKFSPSVHDEDEDIVEEEELLDGFADGADDVLNMLRKLSSSEDTENVETIASPAPSDGKRETVNAGDQVFSFRTLNEVIRLAHVANLSGISSSLYKDTQAGTYLLFLEIGSASASQYNRLCNIASEYGQPMRSANTARAHLEEHFDPLIREDALASLANI